MEKNLDTDYISGEYTAPTTRVEGLRAWECQLVSSLRKVAIDMSQFLGCRFI